MLNNRLPVIKANLPENQASAPEHVADEIQIRAWLAQKRSKETRRIYAREVVAFFKLFPTLLIREIRTAHLAAYIAQKSHLSYSAQAQAKHVLSSLLKFCVRSHFLERDYSLALDPVRVPAQIGFRFLTREEVERLLECSSNLRPRDRLLVHFYFYTGARASEAVSVKWEHLRPVGDKVQVSLIGKGFKARAVTISTKFYSDLLKIQSDRSPYVFHSNKEPYGALSPRQVLRVIKKAAASAKLDKKVSTHYLRHAHASLSLLAGAPLPTVQRGLGHASISSTEKYLHLLSLNKSSGEYLIDFEKPPGKRAQKSVKRKNARIDKK